MNTISYRDLKNWYFNEDAVQLADMVFGDSQPSIYETGFYTSPTWNWGYHIGIVGVHDNEYTPDRTWYEVVTQFGCVRGARQINLPTMVMGR